MRIIRVHLVLKGSTPYRFPTFTGVCRVSALNHEAFHVSMEGGAIVVAAGAEGEEIECGSLGCVAEDFDFDVAEAGVESY
jgi:hypothetical protein